jgi:MFS family permease
MVGVMAVAPVHMLGHGQSLRVIGLVVSVHVAGMFGPSPLTGWWADRQGARIVAGAGAALLLAVGLVGGAAGGGMATLMAELIALGLSWNLGVVGASALLAREVPAVVRPYVEGLGEAVMSVAAGIGAPLAGALLAGPGVCDVWFLVALVALAPLAALRPLRRGPLAGSSQQTGA